MAIVKLAIRKKPLPFVIQKCSNIVKLMTGNLNFPSPNPSLASVSAAISELSEAYELALDGGRLQKAEQRLKAAALFSMMSVLSKYVQNVSLSDEQIILSSGMDVVKKRTKRTKADAPQNLRVRENYEAGQMSIIFKPIPGATAYIVQTTSTPEIEASWEAVSYFSKASGTVKGLASCKVAWLRVAALTSAGTGFYSAAVQKMIS